MENGIKKLKEFEQQMWTTKSKQQIKIKDLSVEHLANIVKNLRTKFEAMEDPINHFPSFRGEMAQMYGESSWDRDNDYYQKMHRTLELFECYYRIKTL